MRLLVLSAIGFWLSCWCSAQPMPSASIKTTFAPSVVLMGQVATATIRMSAYSGNPESDSFNFVIGYDTNSLAVVPESFYLGSSTGGDQQWLSKPNQESVTNAFSLDSLVNTVVPGTIFIAVGDLGINRPERGTVAAIGFLVSFQFVALNPGTTTISLSPESDGSVLLDTSMKPIIGACQLNGATLEIRAGGLPTVTMTSPGEGSIVNVPGKVSMAATASSTNGGIAKVEFFTEATNKLGEVTIAPYGLDWTNPPAGLHTLSAVATDSFGAGASSTPVHITVNTPATITITNPFNNTTFTAPATVAIQATANDSDGSVARVEFYSGSTLLGSDSNAPFAFTWSNVATGSYVLTAKAIDDRGAGTVSAPVNVVVRTNGAAAHIVAAGSFLDSESGPVTGGIDPGETVTIRFQLRNNGGTDTANLTGTLQASGGVTSPSGPQNYGVLTANGPAVGKPFTFTAFGNAGGVVTATLQPQDGTNNLGSLAFPFTLGASTNLSSPGVITINDNAGATPYPSSLYFSGLTGLVNKVTVTLSNINHTFPSDIDVLLVSPGGQKAMILSDAGAGYGLVNVSVTLDDSSTNALPANAAITSGTYKPADFEPGETMPAPAPAGPYANTFSAFTGSAPNGTWSLYVADDSAGDSGRIANGWSLSITTFDPVNPVADLAVTVNHTPEPVGYGSNVTYTVTVTNRGPEDALGVMVTNLLPSGLNFVSAVSTQGSCSNASGTVTCDLGTLTTNVNATVTLVANAASVGTKSFVARLGTAVLDFNQANNSITNATVINGAADLGLTLIASPNPAYINNTLVYTIAVTNRGPTSASGVTVTNALPAGLAFVSATATQGSCSQTSGVVTCNLGTLANAAQATTTITGITPSTAGTLTDVAGVWSASTPDYSSPNNSAVLTVANLNPAYVIIPAGAWLVAESGPVTGSLDPNETVTVAFYLRNIGSADTANLNATLLAGGGVTSPSPSGAQNYGVVLANGPAVCRTNTFTVSGVSGGLLTATLQIQEGGIQLGTVALNFPLGSSLGLTNTSPMIIPDLSCASLYPSSVSVSGLNGGVTKATVTISNINHTFLSDLDILLVGPRGQSCLLLSDAGGGTTVTNLTLTFDDAATLRVPANGAIASGTYRPTDYPPADTFSPPAPAAPYGTNLAVFNGTNPNGTWSLCVLDDTFGDAGHIDGGWWLTLSSGGLVNPPPTQLSLLQAPTNNLCQFLLKGRAGDKYVTECSGDLLNWTPISTNVLVTDSLLFMDSSGTTNTNCRFYRSYWRP